MPKTNDQTGATAAGFSGIVEHGAPIDNGTKFSELDPELNLDGTLIEGEHPDHPAGGKRDHVAPTGAPEPVEYEPDGEVEEPAETPDTAEKEEESSPGISSRTSTAKTAPTRGKSRGSA